MLARQWYRFQGAYPVYYNEFMTAPILATKLFIPPPRPGSVIRQRLLEQLDEGLHRKLTLVSAPRSLKKPRRYSGFPLGGITIVVVDDPAENVATVHRAMNLVACVRDGKVLNKALMRSRSVKEINVFAHDSSEMSRIDDQ